MTALEFEYRLQATAPVWTLVDHRAGQFGEDEHNLRLKRIGGTKTYGIKTVLPGQRRYLAAKLRVGRYNLWCSITDHKAGACAHSSRCCPRRPAPEELSNSRYLDRASR